MPQFELRPMRRDEWSIVAELIYDSTNAWYLANGRAAIFTGARDCTLLFCEVYEALDPGCCVVAEEKDSGRLAGSCFYHPRSTHVSLGIMNVHPEFFGRGVASRLLRFVTDVADEQGKPTRLVSSAVNLDSFSLYSRGGFVPQTFYQDMIMEVPADGIAAEMPGRERVRTATLDDLPAMVALEREINHIEREIDLRYFLENRMGVWHVSVLEGDDGLEGWIASVAHPGSNMVGPGVARTDGDAAALIVAELDHHRGRQPVWLVPARRRALVDAMYAIGAANCELHVAQVRGRWTEPTGVVLPTFMPETG